MNSKRSTPQSKGPPSGPPSASKFRTPTNLNSTLLDRRGSASKNGSLRSQNFLDVTGIGPLRGNASNAPKIKGNLTPFVDHDHNCDAAYGDYLESFKKQKMLQNIISTHQEDVNDQIIIQKDKLYRNKSMLCTIEKELEDMEMFDEITKLTNVMENVSLMFYSEDSDLRNTLEQLLQVLNYCCNKVNVKNVKLIEEQRYFDKVLLGLEKCEKALEKVNNSNLFIETVCQLGNVVEKYEKNVENLAQRQKNLEKRQKNETYRLLKAVSEMYAAQEKYFVVGSS